MQARKHSDKIKKYGSTIVEYGLLLGTFAVLSISSLAVFGQSIVSLFVPVTSATEQSSGLTLKLKPGARLARTQRSSWAERHSETSAATEPYGQAVLKPYNPLAVSTSSEDGAGMVLASADTLQ